MFRAITLLALVLAACSSPSGNRVSGDAHFERALLFPLNVVVAMPGELESGAGRVDVVLESYLKGRGKTFETFDFADARKVWLASIKTCLAEKAKGCNGFDGAAGILARSLREQREFDVLILPNLVMRPARMDTRDVKWDGVTRTIETVGEMKSKKGFIYANLFEGKTQAPSLALFVFSGDGKKIFQGMGGLDLAHRVRVVANERTQSVYDDRWGFELRPEVFADPAHLREGVAVAFYPLLAKEEPEAR